MAARGGRSGSCSVFVGNIPYGVTEEDLKKIFSSVGPVETFRIVVDRDTGKPKGYGFCEYRDAETAASAMRNLNNHPIKGRQLRVDNADNDAKPNARATKANDAGGTAGPGPGGNLLPQAEGAPDFLVGMTDRQVFDVLVQFKDFASKNPNQARQLLVGNPHLSQALLQAQIKLKMVPAQKAPPSLPPPGTGGPALAPPGVSSGSGTSGGAMPPGVGGPPPGVPQQGRPPQGGPPMQMPPGAGRPAGPMGGGPPGGPMGGGPPGGPMGGGPMGGGGGPPGMMGGPQMGGPMGGRPPMQQGGPPMQQGGPPMQQGGPPMGGGMPPGQMGGGMPPGQMQRPPGMMGPGGPMQGGGMPPGQMGGNGGMPPGQMGPGGGMPPQQQQQLPPQQQQQQPPPQQQQQQQQQQQGGGVPADLASQEQQLMAQIMNFSEEQIRQLPPDQQAQYWKIRNMAEQRQ